MIKGDLLWNLISAIVEVNFWLCKLYKGFVFVEYHYYFCVKKS